MNRRFAPWLIAFVLFSPIVFSAVFSRIYDQKIFLFFPDPKGDDEGYFDHLNVWFSSHCYGTEQTDTCRVPKNYRGIGAASLWAPGYLAFQWGGAALQRALGFSELHGDEFLRIGAATCNYGIATACLLLLILILSPWMPLWEAVMLSHVLFFAGPAPYYFFRRVLMSHAAESFYFLLAVYGIQRIHQEENARAGYIWTGIALAGVVATRWQDIAACGILGLLLSYQYRKSWRNLVLLAIIGGIAILPQLWANNLNWGQWLIPSGPFLSFMSPSALFEVGPVQIKRLFHILWGPDWGLVRMFPWLLLAFFISPVLLRSLWHSGKSWIVGSLLTVLITLNYRAHGASYAHRYVLLFVWVLGIFAALGFSRLRQSKYRFAAWVFLAAGTFISLLHYTAFESDAKDLTLLTESIALEGPVRPEYLVYSPIDWVNGQFSRNVYGLLIHPKALARTFGAAPLPLYLARQAPRLLGRSPSPQVLLYIDKHSINFSSYARYLAMLLVGNGFLLLGWIFYTRRHQR